MKEPPWASRSGRARMPRVYGPERRRELGGPPLPERIRLAAGRKSHQVSISIETCLKTAIIVYVSLSMFKLISALYDFMPHG
jgi:hypothetical protein